MKFSGLVTIAVATFGISTFSATAQTVPDKDLKECASKSNVVSRISCYDALAAKHKFTTETNTTVRRPSKNWTVSDTTNPLDDTRTVIISTTSTSGRSSYGNSITLIARCKSNETELYINWNDYLGDDSSNVYSEYKYVTTRIGSAKAETNKWSVSTDSKATFAPGWAGEWIKRISKENELVVQTTPYGENPVTAVFDVSGLRTAAEPLAETCGWSFE
ncbi:type VI secretion system-associated protein TagO [Hyphomonas sp. NPDC076900]|uniref:type VI secretion system-associated protein TagO n=1 Tax=unclassified Hyphomonas TaxID=2630699 RepID=UPI003D042A4A